MHEHEPPSLAASLLQPIRASSKRHRAWLLVFATRAPGSFRTHIYALWLLVTGGWLCSQFERLRSTRIRADIYQLSSKSSCTAAQHPVCWHRDLCRAGTAFKESQSRPTVGATATNNRTAMPQAVPSARPALFKPNSSHADVCSGHAEEEACTLVEKDGYGFWGDQSTSVHKGWKVASLDDCKVRSYRAQQHRRLQPRACCACSCAGMCNAAALSRVQAVHHQTPTSACLHSKRARRHIRSAAR